MSEYRAIRVEKGSGGFGGPLTIQGTEKKNKVMFITGGGVAPEILEKIVALSGLTPVNGFKTSCPEDELALVIIDCGGTLRCGLYPKKRIPTININPVGKAGPLAQFIKEDIYVSGVTNANIALADGSAAAVSEDTAAAAGSAPEAEPASGEKKGKIDSTKKLSEQMAESGNGNLLAKIGLGAGKVVATFNQAARDAVQTAITTLLPFMAFVSMLIGIINGTGFGTFFSGLLQPLLGSIPGLLTLGIICSIPGLSAILGPGAVISQILGGIMGAEIGAGRISPSLALVGLFALNCQCACDFIPVGLGMSEARPQTTQIGIAAVTFSRFATGWIRILIALLFSIGL